MSQMEARMFQLNYANTSMRRHAVSSHVIGYVGW